MILLDTQKELSINKLLNNKFEMFILSTWLSYFVDYFYLKVMNNISLYHSEGPDFQNVSHRKSHTTY